MVALDFGHWRERAATRSRRRGFPLRRPWRAVLAAIFAPEVAGAWLLVAVTALVFALLLGLKDQPAADAAAVDRALVQAERSAHPPPACRPEDERFAPC